jgi:hypothetical protein
MSEPVIKELFPTFLLEHTNVELADALLPLCNKYTAESSTNCLHIENFPTTLYNRQQEDEVNNEPVVQQTLEYLVEICLKPLLARRNISIPTKLNPYGFFSSMEKHAYLRKHAHLDCLFSGIIYLEAGEDVPPLVIYDPRPVRLFRNYPLTQFPPADSSIHIVYPEKGKILLWDSYLEHEVYQKLNDNPRKTFVFNL